jgi:hypothetical protein
MLLFALRKCPASSKGAASVHRFAYKCRAYRSANNISFDFYVAPIILVLSHSYRFTYCSRTRLGSTDQKRKEAKNKMEANFKIKHCPAPQSEAHTHRLTHVSTHLSFRWTLPLSMIFQNSWTIKNDISKADFHKQEFFCQNVLLKFCWCLHSVQYVQYVCCNVRSIESTKVSISGWNWVAAEY